MYNVYTIHHVNGGMHICAHADPHYYNIHNTSTSLIVKYTNIDRISFKKLYYL